METLDAKDGGHTAVEFESSNATLAITAARRCRSHSCALDARPPPTVPRTARWNTAHRKRGGLAIKAVIDYSNAHTNTNVTE